MATRDRESTRAAIWTAAHRMFLERGYAGTPLRDIAGAAGVDAAMIIRYFSSKEELFLETMHLDPAFTAVMDGPLETLGTDFIDSMLSSGEQARSVYLALMRASDSTDIGSRLKEAHENYFVAPLRRRLDGPDAELRARLAAALVGGLLYSLWVVGDEHLQATDHTVLVRWYGGLLQELVTPKP
ncbi:MAG: TetR family transcriptional regulator [Rhodoglobus sp.]